MGALLVGFGIGFLVAAQIGPISLLLVRSTLRGGLAIGLAIAASVAVIDLSYATLGALGASRALTVEPVRIALGVLGAAVMAGFAARTLWSAFRVRLGGEGTAELASPRAAFATGLAATASNPLTIISWAAIFAAASTASVADTTGATIALLAGIALGSLTWKTTLALGTTLARKRLGERAIAAVDIGAGVGMLGFAGLLGWRTLNDR